MATEAQMESTWQDSVARVQTILSGVEKQKALAVEAGLGGYELGVIDGMISALRMLEDIGQERVGS